MRGTCESCQAEDVELIRLDNEYGIRGINFRVCDECLESIKSDYEDSENDSTRKEVEESGPGPWRVVKTRFHGGGIIVESGDIDVIVSALRKFRSGDCVCGCAGVVSCDTDLPGTEQNDRNGYSPYALTD